MDLVVNPAELANIDPAKTVHLCIDVQDRYFNSEKSGSEKSEAVAAQIRDMAPVFKQHGIETWWVYHEGIGKGEPFFLVEPAEGDVIIPKSGWSAFDDDTNLKYKLQKRDIGTLIITGGYTDCCVYETARNGVNFGFNVVALADCVVEMKRYFLGLAETKLNRIFSHYAQHPPANDNKAFFAHSDEFLAVLREKAGGVTPGVPEHSAPAL